MSTIAGPQIVSSGLIYDLDAGNSSVSLPVNNAVIKNWYDVSGNGFVATAPNGIVYSALYGGTLIFDGLTQLIDLGISAYGLGIVRKATFSGWMMTNSSAAYLVSDWNGLGMTLRFNGPTSADFYVYGSNRRITATYTFNVGSWYNIVGVMDGDNMYMYINSALVGTQTLAEDIGASPSTLKIGTRGDGSDRPAQTIGCLQIYNRALSAEEILQNYNALRIRYGL